MVSLVLAQVFIYALARSSSEHPSLPSPDVSEISLPSSSSWAKPLISQPASCSFKPTLPNPSPCWQELADSSRCVQPPRCSGTVGLGGSCCSLGDTDTVVPEGCGPEPYPCRVFLGSQAQCYCASVILVVAGINLSREDAASSCGIDPSAKSQRCSSSSLPHGW